MLEGFALEEFVGSIVPIDHEEVFGQRKRDSRHEALTRISKVVCVIV